MKTVKEIKEEMKRVEEERDYTIDDGMKDWLNTRYWTLKWVLGEEE